MMRFRPAWVYLDGIRDFCEFFCRTTFGDSAVADRASVLVQETLENAIKYSSSNSESELELMISAGVKRIEFSVTSTPDSSHLDSLKAELARLNDMDPEEAFLAALERSQTEPDASARIGLARMRYEGGAKLRLKEEADGRIRFMAIGAL
jgi:hypothetical protein